MAYTLPNNPNPVLTLSRNAQTDIPSLIFRYTSQLKANTSQLVPSIITDHYQGQTHAGWPV